MKPESEMKLVLPNPDGAKELRARRKAELSRELDAEFIAFLKEVSEASLEGGGEHNEGPSSAVTSLPRAARGSLK